MQGLLKPGRKKVAINKKNTDSIHRKESLMRTALYRGPSPRKIISQGGCKSNNDAQDFDFRKKANRQLW